MTQVATERTPRIVAARKLVRRSVRAEQGAFLAEGPQAVRSALAANARVRQLFVDDALRDRYADILQDAGTLGIDAVPATARALAALSETVSPQGVVAVCDTFAEAWPRLLADTPRLLAVPVDVRDPGNAGTIIRTADAAGAAAVLMAGSSVDLYNGKVVRATAGSMFHLPIGQTLDPLAAVAEMQRGGLTVLATQGEGADDLDDLLDAGELSGRVAWLFGNEAHGLPAEVAAAADRRVRIAIRGRAESLNLASAAAVCLFATARAHRR